MEAPEDGSDIVHDEGKLVEQHFCERFQIAIFKIDDMYYELYGSADIPLYLYVSNQLESRDCAHCGVRFMSVTSHHAVNQTNTPLETIIQSPVSHIMRMAL